MKIAVVGMGKIGLSLAAQYVSTDRLATAA